MTPVKEVKPKAEVVVEEGPFYQDPFRPVLLNSPSLHTTVEQENWIKEILDICCSDSAFAKKAYAGLQFILTGADPLPPVLSSLTPSTTVIATPVTVTVTGTGFVDGAVVHSGGPIATTFVSETELSFSPDVTMDGVQSVHVVNPDLLASNSLDFTVTAVTLRSPVKDVLKKEEEFYTPKKEDKK